jgi:hypothetical protein
MNDVSVLGWRQASGFSWEIGAEDPRRVFAARVEERSRPQQSAEMVDGKAGFLRGLLKGEKFITNVPDCRLHFVSVRFANRGYLRFSISTLELRFAAPSSSDFKN